MNLFGPIFVIGIITFFSNSRKYHVSAAEEANRETLNSKELLKFCQSKDPSLHKVGHHHPYYCSKYIYCSLEAENEHSNPQIVYEEHSCPKCPGKSPAEQVKDGRLESGGNSCPHGFMTWDEEKQKCHEPGKLAFSTRRRKHRKCRQEELPQNNIWGVPSYVGHCEKAKTGIVTNVDHPTDCTHYIECYKDPNYIGDVYVQVKRCPECVIGPDCPEGIEVHKGNGTCEKSPLTGKEKCKRPEGEAPVVPPSIQPVTKRPLDPKKPPVGGNETEAAKQFCQGKSQEPKRYANNDDCHKYFSCNHGRFDKNGEEIGTHLIKHLEFQCPRCEKTKDSRCPGGFLNFHAKLDECVSPKEAPCAKDGPVDPEKGVTPVIPGPEKGKDKKWREPTLSDEAVAEFCKGKNNVSGDYPVPGDETCGRFITCWFQQNYFREKACYECKLDAVTCPYGYLHFDTKTQPFRCEPANVSTCVPKKDARDNSPIEGPPVIPPPVATTPRSTAGGSEEPPPEEEVTPPPEEDESELLEPKECDLKNYVQRGYCKSYFTCDRKTRFEKINTCSSRLYWNPDTNTIHGGTCDYLRNIDNFTLFQYKKDPGCPLHVAYFRADDKECSGTYFYHHPTRTEGKEKKLHCPEDLLFNPDVKTCVKCHDARKKDGSLCCAKDAQKNNKEIHRDRR